jgi:MFS superfamily sulfate permease-like transporter
MGQFRPLTARRVGPRRKGFSTFGLILIAVGVATLLITYFLPGWVPRLWPLLIVALGLLGLVRRPAFIVELETLVPGLASAADRQRRRFSLALVVLGLVLLIFTSRLVDDRIAGPAVIIALGLALLWRRYR